MGAINYNENEIIKLGYDISLLEEDDEGFFMHDFIEDIEEKINPFQSDYRLFKVNIEYGYYEGFYLHFEDNTGWCFADWREKREAFKELTWLKETLIACVKEDGLRSFGGRWCQRFYDYEDTIEEIKKGINKMKEYIRAIPTSLYYDRNQPCIRR